MTATTGLATRVRRSAGHALPAVTCAPGRSLPVRGLELRGGVRIPDMHVDAERGQQ